MEVDDSRFIIQLNQQVTRNKEAGLPLNQGIDTPSFERFISIIRGNRATASTGNPTGKGRKKIKPMEDAAILKLFQ